MVKWSVVDDAREVRSVIGTARIKKDEMKSLLNAFPQLFTLICVLVLQLIRIDASDSTDAARHVCSQLAVICVDRLQSAICHLTSNPTYYALSMKPYSDGLIYTNTIHRRR
jgi:hypothetical protein